MPGSIVVGGQYGSEGKGKIACYLAREMNAAAAIRVGGSNSGHSVVGADGNLFIFRHLPTAAILSDVICVLPAGSYIDADILHREITLSGLDRNRLIIDPLTMIINEADIKAEQAGGLMKCIGSTGSGTGAAVLRRTQRSRNTMLAKDCPSLAEFIEPTTPLLRKLLDKGERIIIEGTQGFGLSLLHSPHYPFTTSRDTTAAGFLAETGLSPLDVDDIVLVIRSYPIRVGGNSGPLPGEVDWDYVTIHSGSSVPLEEYTSVTKNKRRVAKFDPSIVLDAIRVNKPTRIALNHIDYLDIGCRAINDITDKARREVTEIETMTGTTIELLGYGPGRDQLFQRSHAKRETILHNEYLPSPVVI